MAPFRIVSLCAAGRTKWNRAFWDSLGRVILYRMPQLSLRWLHSQRNCQSSGGSVGLSWHMPRVPYCSLLITRLKTGSGHWAWCQSSMVKQVTSRLSSTESTICRLQLHALMGLVGPLSVASCTACMAAAVTWRWVAEALGMHPG